MHDLQLQILDDAVTVTAYKRVRNGRKRVRHIVIERLPDDELPALVKEAMAEMWSQLDEAGQV